MARPKRIMNFPDMGREVWAKWDADSQMYELFASEDCNDYLGCADTLAEAKKAAQAIADDWMAD